MKSTNFLAFSSFLQFFIIYTPSGLTITPSSIYTTFTGPPELTYFTAPSSKVSPTVYSPSATPLYTADEPERSV